jgi:RNA polymerase sigma-70 factor (ECF subfamily)
LTSPSDGHLIDAALKGSEKAFRQLVERHHPLAYSAVRSVLGDRDDVEDVVQDTFIKVYRGLATFRTDARFSTWLYRIARNEAISHVRKKTLSGPPIEETVLESPVASRPDEQYRVREEQSLMNGYLAQLEEKYRTVLELRYLGERSYQEISDAMELPIGTVKSYIYRAKAELKRVMARDEMAPEQGK